MAKKKVSIQESGLRSHKEILEEIRDIKDDTAEAVRIQYGIKEFFQGLMIGIIMGFILAWILFKYA